MSTLHRRVIRLALTLVLAVPVLLLGTARAGADDPAYGAGLTAPRFRTYTRETGTVPAKPGR